MCKSPNLLTLRKISLFSEVPQKIFLIPIPAIIIGSLAMYINDVSINIWGQNILGLVIGVLLSHLISRRPKIINNIFTVPISIILLLLTFLDPGLEGVHRWISYWAG